MRRRGFDELSAGDGAASAPSARKQVESVLKGLDMYSNKKIAAEFATAPSARSARLAKVGYGVMAVLFLWELRVYLRVEERDHVVVDKSLGKRMEIRLNVTFPKLTCAEVHLDAMDTAGDYHPYMEQHMTKQRLDSKGRAIPHEVLREVANEHEHGPPSGCGSCFGAESDEQPCCDTCDELLRAYGTKGWAAADIKVQAPQCSDAHLDTAIAAIKKGEGCNLAGFLEVNKVAGNVHIAMGESAVQNGRFVHQFDPTHAHAFDVSHVVHDFRFGDSYAGMALPLVGAERTVDPRVGTGLFQYFIKLVPTIYRASEGAPPVKTVRYSYTARFRPLSRPDIVADLAFTGDHGEHARATAPQAVLPGVFFVYDFSAFMVEVTRHRNTFSHFLVRVAAIGGGVTTVVGFLDFLLTEARARGFLG